jgi:hypothetical protein
MSCDVNARKAAKSAPQVGLSAVSSRLSHATGVLADRALLSGYRLAARAAVVSDAVLDTIDRRGLVARLSRSRAVQGIVIGAALEALGRRKVSQGGGDVQVQEEIPGATFTAIGAGKILPAAATATAVHQLSTHLASMASRATREEQIGAVWQRRPVSLMGMPLGEADEEVSLWQSSLTKTLNSLDAPIPGQTKALRAGDGVLFKTGDVTWHRGTLIADTPKGERMLTHLQSLNVPATHYYFRCYLSDEQAVGIAARRVRAEHLPGYVGQVSALESLTLAWGAAKHAMIRNVIYFASEREPQRPAPRPRIRGAVTSKWCIFRLLFLMRFWHVGNG